MDQTLIWTHQFPSFNVQRLGELLDIVDPDISVAAFHRANVCPIEAGHFRKLFLRNALRKAQISKIRRECPAQ